MDVLPEPVDKWTNLNGTDLLDLLFKDPKRWALAQESYVQLTMLEEHLVRFPPVNTGPNALEMVVFGKMSL